VHYAAVAAASGPHALGTLWYIDRVTPFLLPLTRPLSTAEVLDTAFRVFQVTLWRCLLLALAAVVVGQAPAAYDLARGTLTAPVTEKGLVWAALYVASTFLNVLLALTLLYRQWRLASGEQRSLGHDLRDALRRWPQAFATALAVFTLLLLPAAGIGFVWAMPDLLVRSLLLPPLVLLLCWIGVPLFLTVQIGMLEALSVRRAIARSFELVRGHWWRTLLALVVGTVVVLVFYTIGGLLGALIARLLGGADIAVFSVVTTVIVAMLGGLFMPFFTALSLVILLELRLRREVAAPASRADALAT
jgi:hypothetical protein